jgi:hypothetical protein
MMYELNIFEISDFPQILCSETSPSLAKGDSLIKTSTHGLHSVHASRVSEENELDQALLSTFSLQVK